MTLVCWLQASNSALGNSSTSSSITIHCTPLPTTMIYLEAVSTEFYNPFGYPTAANNKHDHPLTTATGSWHVTFYCHNQMSNGLLQSSSTKLVKIELERPPAKKKRKKVLISNYISKKKKKITHHHPNPSKHADCSFVTFQC